MMYIYCGDKINIAMVYTDKFKKKFIEILEKSDMDVKAACTKAKIHRRTYYNWMEKDEWFRREIEHMVEADIDDSESLHRLHRKGQPKFVLTQKKDKSGSLVYDKLGRAVMIRAVDENGQWIQDGWHIPPSREAIEFHLKTKGKNRGYGTGLQHENGTLQLVVNMLDS